MRKSGDPVPQVTFRLRRDGAWEDKTSDTLFKGRNVVVFAVPGAFSASCSARHLPGYVALSKNIRAMGIDEIFCVAVNDAFVMNAWARDQGIAGEVTLLPDGNGDFTRGMGMLTDRSDLGFGARSWRYAMIVRDGIIDQIFIEDPNRGADPFDVSDAISVLDFLDRQALRAVAE
jgi:peroxiredoxin